VGVWVGGRGPSPTTWRADRPTFQADRCFALYSSYEYFTSLEFHVDRRPPARGRFTTGAFCACPLVQKGTKQRAGTVSRHIFISSCMLLLLRCLITRNLAVTNSSSALCIEHDSRNNCLHMTYACCCNWLRKLYAVYLIYRQWNDIEGRSRSLTVIIIIIIFTFLESHLCPQKATEVQFSRPHMTLYWRSLVYRRRYESCRSSMPKLH